MGLRLRLPASPSATPDKTPHKAHRPVKRKAELGRIFEFFGLRGRYGDRPYDGAPNGEFFRRAGHRTGQSKERLYKVEI